MLENRIKEKLDSLYRDIEDLKKHADADAWDRAVKAFEQQMAQPDFWNDQQNAAKVNRRVKNLKDQIETFNTIISDIDAVTELAEIADETNQNEIEEMTDNLQAMTDELQTKLLFTDDLDESNAVLEIHPGAGGTESCDWADILNRMYGKFFQKKGFKAEILDYEAGDVAGLKSISINITGEYAYGFLKSEIGVHRLVRVSPFDSNNRRHTSFAAVYVYPDIDKDLDFELDENDLKIDVFRSSGPGGQNVNKLSTAVRITHVPTNIIAKCQTERSQHKNKQNAMKMLKAKVYEHYRQIEEEKINAQLAEKRKIEWGNQIRSYVFYPYKMVKDLRTKYETSNVDFVMDGNIDRFIKEYLIMKAKTGGKND